MEVYGATGYAITVGPDKVRICATSTIRRSGCTTAPSLSGPQNNSLSYLAAVCAASWSPKGDLTALDTNVIVMQILDAARESARTGKSVKLTSNSAPTPESTAPQTPLGPLAM
jgi:glucose-fructose oxidoreductase